MGTSKSISIGLAHEMFVTLKKVGFNAEMAEKLSKNSKMAEKVVDLFLENNKILFNCGEEIVTRRHGEQVWLLKYRAGIEDKDTGVNTKLHIAKQDKEKSEKYYDQVLNVKILTDNVLMDNLEMIPFSNIGYALNACMHVRSAGRADTLMFPYLVGGVWWILRYQRIKSIPKLDSFEVLNTKGIAAGVAFYTPKEN